MGAHSGTAWAYRRRVGIRCGSSPTTTTVLQLVALDLAEYRSSEDDRRLLVAVGIRERAEFRIYLPQWRRMSALRKDGECVIVGDGDAERGEMAWAAVYHVGQLVAGLAEPQTPPDDTPLQ